MFICVHDFTVYNLFINLSYLFLKSYIYFVYFLVSDLVKMFVISTYVFLKVLKVLISKDIDFQATGMSGNNDERRLANSSSGNNYSSMGYTGPYGVTTPTSTQSVQPRD